MAPSELQVHELLRPLLLKDLRNQCRARGLSPGGSRETLMERVQQHMIDSCDLTLVSDFTGEVLACAGSTENREDAFAGLGNGNNNNYVRPEGQNTGNFITDRPSSRVLAPPGGTVNVTIGGGCDDIAKPAPTGYAGSVGLPGVARTQDAGGFATNNYVRPEGQNVGNFLSDRPSSRVLAPPGGGSQVFFG